MDVPSPAPQPLDRANLEKLQAAISHCRLLKSLPDVWQEAIQILLCERKYLIDLTLRLLGQALQPKDSLSEILGPDYGGYKKAAYVKPSTRPNTARPSGG